MTSNNKFLDNTSLTTSDIPDVVDGTIDIYGKTLRATNIAPNSIVATDSQRRLITATSFSLSGDLDMNGYDILDVDFLSGTLTDSSQPNITSVGTLDTLSTSGILSNTNITNNTTSLSLINGNTTGTNKGQISFATSSNEYKSFITSKHDATSTDCNITFKVNYGDNTANLSTGTLDTLVLNGDGDATILGTIYGGSGSLYLNSQLALTDTSLGSSVLSSSLTSVGTLSSLNMGGDVDLNTNDIIGAGNIAIGYDTPNFPLDVFGQNGGGDIVALKLHNDSVTANSSVTMAFGISTTDTATTCKITAQRLSSQYQDLYFTTYNSGPTEQFRMKGNGNFIIVDGDIEIGTSSVLNSTTLGSSVVNSSLQNLGIQDADLNMGGFDITNVGNLSGTLIVDGDIDMNGFSITGVNDIVATGDFTTDGGFYGRNTTYALYATAAQSIPDTTPTLVIFDAVDWQHNNTITYGSGTFTFDAAAVGVYLISYSLSFDNNGSGGRYAYLQHNTPGGTELERQAVSTITAQAVYPNTLNGSSIFLIGTFNETVKLWVEQDSGGARNLGGASTDIRSSIQIYKLGLI